MAVVLAGALTLAAFAFDLTPGDGPVPPAESAVVEVDVEAPPEPLSPRDYLYASYPQIARRMDCVISHESRWYSGAVNPRSGASGLAQFLASTWRSTPPGRAGASVFDPYANIDGAAWLARYGGGWTHWVVVLNGFC
jgi:hypothetical protein